MQWLLLRDQLRGVRGSGTGTHVHHERAARKVPLAESFSVEADGEEMRPSVWHRVRDRVGAVDAALHDPRGVRCDAVSGRGSRRRTTPDQTRPRARMQPTTHLHERVMHGMRRVARVLRADDARNERRVGDGVSTLVLRGDLQMGACASGGGADAVPVNSARCDVDDAREALDGERTASNLAPAAAVGDVHLAPAGLRHDVLQEIPVRASCRPQPSLPHATCEGVRAQRCARAPGRVGYLPCICATHFASVNARPAIATSNARVSSARSRPSSSRTCTAISCQGSDGGAGSRGAA